MDQIPGPGAAPTGYRVREASSGDARPLAELYRREAELHQRLAGYYRLEPDFDWVGFVRYRLRPGGQALFVAEQDGLIGFLYTRISGYRPPSPPGSGLRRLLRWRRASPGLPVQPLAWGVIDDCFVLEAFRRRGVGEALVAQALRWLESGGIRRVELSVLERNRAARAFWEKVGFSTFRHTMHREGT